MADELKPCVDSSRDGNGRPGSGIIFPAVDKLLRAVSALMDACDDTGADRRFALSLVTRRENELISAAAKHDAKVAALRAEVERLRAENAKALRAWDDGAAIRTKENDALRAEVAALKAMYAEPLTDAQVQAVWNNMAEDGDYDYVPDWDAAIRAAREEER